MNCFNDSQNPSDDISESTDSLDPFLCFPEDMTKHQLLRLFKMRYFNVPKDLLIDGYDYSNLIALYNRVLLPLPQRKYGNNRKSRELAIKQIDCNKCPDLKRKFEDNNNVFNKVKDKPIEQSITTNARQVSNQRHDNKRQRISWP